MVLKSLKVKPFVSSVSSFLIFVAALLASGLWAAYFFPQLIYFVEQLLGKSLVYEMHLRMYLGGMVFILLIAYLFFILLKKAWDELLNFSLLSLAFLPLLLVFIFDTRHSLIEEMSWIRYPSALFLLLAGVVFFFLSRQFNVGGKWPKREEAVYLLLSAAFLFAGFDEIGEFHEKIGYVLEKLFSLAHLTTDLVTVFYFVLGVIAIFWMAPVIFERTEGKSQFFGQVCFFALLLFGLSTFLDTVDGVILKFLRTGAENLVNRNYFFSDAWYIFYEPKRFLNGLEEVLEYFAAVLFFAAGLWRLKSGIAKEEPMQFKNPQRKALLVGILLLILVALPFFFKAKNRFSPLESEEEVQIVASVKDGLFHSDDLEYAKEWGIILANESEPKRKGQLSGPGVLVFKDGVFKKLPDAKKELRDIDSVTFCSPGICVSDGALGKIFYYEADNGFLTLLDRSQGLASPEGLVGREKELFILDESQKTVSHFDRQKKVLTTLRPQHPLFQAPEGIDYHPKLDALLITDDKTGVIFQYRFGDKIEVWSKNVTLKSPEDVFVTAEGEVLVTDNGLGELVLLGAGGRVKQTWRFRPLFRDLQGVAVDEKGDIYVVSADSFGSSSFIPSYLWKISMNQ